jgi:hypothetical protein
MVMNAVRGFLNDVRRFVCLFLFTAREPDFIFSHTLRPQYLHLEMVLALRRCEQSPTVN